LEVPDFTKPLVKPFDVVDQFIPRCLETGFPACFCAGSGFTLSTTLVDITTLLKWMVKKPEVAHRLFRKVNEMLMGQVDYFAKKYGGANLLPMWGAPSECNKIISPKMYKDFVHPYAIELHQKFYDVGMEGVFFHGCCDHTMNMPYFIELRESMDWAGKYLWHCGIETPLQMQIDAFGDHDIVCGCIDPTSCVTKSYDEVKELCREVIEIGKNSPSGFMLSTGCELPAISKPTSLAAMVDASKEYGQY
jgi:uroporphyrinogen decarboxylase